MLNFKDDKVYEGISQAKTLYNISGSKIYEGISKAQCVANWDGGELSPAQLVVLITQLR